MPLFCLIQVDKSARRISALSRTTVISGRGGGDLNAARIHLKATLIKKTLTKNPSIVGLLKIKTMHIFIVANGISFPVTLSKVR